MELGSGHPASHLVSGTVALAACAAMAFFYVAVLYFPTLVLRLPHPASLQAFLLRRFACAAVASVVSAVSTAALLGVGRSGDVSLVLSVFGIRGDHWLVAAVVPLLLTSLLYWGSFVSKLWSMVGSWSRCRNAGSEAEFFGTCMMFLVGWVHTKAGDVVAWRNYVVAPFTEELVFRACMIPLLLCGGLRPVTIIFFCPVFFSLAHLNHLMELHYEKGHSFSKAFLIVGLQLVYTVIFGWYAAFLFIRTGNLLSPIVAHIFCNFMGLPTVTSPRTRGVATFALVAGAVAFFWLLLPATVPNFYNDDVDHCNCWHGYCRLT